MSRYIALNKVLSELGLDHKDYVYIDKHEVAERIKKIPSIDIVRCKECKHWHEFIDAKGQGRCEADKHNPFRVSVGVSYADFFCSYGERVTNTAVEDKPTPIRDYMVRGERSE